MLKFEDILKYYNKDEIYNPKHLLREYLQCKILEGIQDTKIAGKISFLGGTSIKIVHGSSRFSEDLDFDNFGLSFDDFTKASEKVKRTLELEGFDVEIRNIKKGAYHCYVNFPHLLYENKLSPIEGEKILIQIDTVAQGFNYVPTKYLLNKFEVTKTILTTPIDILLSQKLYTAFNRKRTKGRDFYDISYLLPLTKPNFEYLNFKLGIKNTKSLKEYILAKSEKLDFKLLSQDVEPFIPPQKSPNKVLLFTEVIKQSL